MNKFEPVSRMFGGDRMNNGGLPLCWFYISKFLDKNKEFIKGKVLEIGENRYTKIFGGDKVTQSDVLHAAAGNSNATIVGDLSNATNIETNSFDCLILTQTLQCIYNLKDTIKEIHRILKPGGTVLVTLAGISQISRYDMDRWGEYWRFTDASALKLFQEAFLTENIEIDTYGNVKLAQAYLDGLVTSDVDPDLLDYVDKDYQMLITVKATKSNENIHSTSEKKFENTDLDLLTKGWDSYAKNWEKDSFNIIDNTQVDFIGDEWTYEDSSQGNINYGLNKESMREFDKYIYQELIDKYIGKKSQTGLEIGPGGGRITKFLVDRFEKLYLADSSQTMLDALKKRFETNSNLKYLMIEDGRTIPEVKNNTLDYVISFDVFVHFEPRLVFWYLKQIVDKLKPGGTAIIHYANPHSEIGWRQFLVDLPTNLEQRKNFASFGVMTPELMTTFVERLNCELLKTDLEMIPRDSVTILKKKKLTNASMLIYHRVVELEKDSQLLAVSPENFDSQLKYLKENYNVISIDEFNDKIKTNELNQDDIVLTFDDGYYDNFNFALPILEKHKLPATIFITTGFIGKQKNTWWDDLEYLLTSKNLPESILIGGNTFSLVTPEDRYNLHNILWTELKKMPTDKINEILNYLYTSVNIERSFRSSHRFMNSEELKEMAKSEFITIGAHTVNHPSLSCLTKEEQAIEIFNSKKELEEILNTPVKYFSYPFGSPADYNQITIDLVSNQFELGISNIQSEIKGIINKFEIPRLLVRNFSLGEFTEWINLSNKNEIENEYLNQRIKYFK